MNAEQVIEMLGVRFDPTKFGPSAQIILEFSDLDETHLLGVSNAAIHHRAAPDAEVIGSADVVVRLAKPALIDMAFNPERYDVHLEAGDLSVQAGDSSVFQGFLDALEVVMTPSLIEPQRSH
jgi:alkyl sulfatase BDS1-like metallo-beta-lactamase superfamily hydrolase